MKKHQLSDAVLGIFVNANRVEAVLLRASGKQYDLVGRFARQRMRMGELVGAGSLATVLPGLKTSEDSDFTIQIGDGGGQNSDMFLASEFVGLGTKAPGTTAGGSSLQSAPFVQPLREILSECRALGYERPKLAFCVGAPDVSYVELFTTRDQADAAARKKSWSLPQRTGPGLTPPGANRRHLLDLLAAQHQGSFDEGRVAFLPMSPLKGQQRYLAVVPERSESVTDTLDLTTQDKGVLLDPHLLGTEMSLYAALIRQAYAPASNENTVVVRVGSEDTLTLFLSGVELRHFERLRSLSTYDPPETICSRVLLQQDEQKIGEVHRVLVLSEGRQEQFQAAFRQFYPNAAVEPLQRALFNRGVIPSEKEEDGLRSSAVPAAGIGLSVLERWEQDDLFGAVNLLPKKLRRKPRQRFAFAWHTFVMLGVLFAVSFFFVTRYLGQQAQIDRSRQELQLLNMPDLTRGSAAQLQARVDSLQRVYQQYTHALHILDSLLYGSDQWSRTLEKTANATRDLSGVWFDSWQPSGPSIRIEGNARSRERVAQLAQRLDGTIHETAFQDLNDVRIHPFTMVVPRPIGMPRVADYLKDAVEMGRDPSGQARASSAASPTQPRVFQQATNR